MQLALGTVIESIMGSLRFSFFYPIVVIGSCLFGAVVNPRANAIGAEPVIFGLVAAIFASIVVYWSKIDAAYCTKITIIFQICFVLVICILLTSQQSANVSRFAPALYLAYPDLLGSIGGFIYGFAAGLFLMPAAPMKVQGKFNFKGLIGALIGATILVVLTVVLVVVLFASPAYLQTPPYDTVN